MSQPPLRYRSPDEDSGRWSQFRFRPGDIVISTRSKHGTTWMQMICALLVFRSADLPAPLAELSPWLDWLVLPQDDVLAELRHQRHRRLIKTHTPLDGIPLDPRVWYIVVGRHPLDAAVSLYHQGDNLDRQRIQHLTGNPGPTSASAAREALPDWLDAWIARDANPRLELDSLPGVMHHLGDAWSRRTDSNVVLVRYDDLCADLEGQMRQLADRLSIRVPESRWPSLVSAAGLPAMRERAGQLVPDPVGVLKDSAAFFRRGGPGAAREVLSEEQLARYHQRVTQLAPADLLAWLHRDGTNIDHQPRDGPEPSPQPTGVR
jgi:aryl sulfotransferase